ncbi:MAG: acyl-CoA dehydrogenase family protein [Acidimicrobiia bacterium]|nr:acyl-CoA dehydrogenase family protein [Acidimicrobiia bacterium]
MMDGAERDLFVETLTRAIESATGAALDAALGEFGWREALADDPATAVSVLFDQQGRAGSNSSALDAVVAHRLGVDEAVAVVLPPIGKTLVDTDGGRFAGLGTMALTSAERAVVVLGDQLVTVAIADLQQRSISGIDSDLGLVGVSGSIDAGAASTGADWTAACAAGHRALAHELIGTARTMLGFARDHAVDRIQFGQPIAAFQAIRHRLADAYVAIEGAHEVAEAAWLDGTPLTAAGAKAVAGRSARTVARHAQQVLAGIGFTTEHDLHRFIRRSMVLDSLLGDTRTLTRAMGADILRQRGLPPMQPL